MLLAATVYTRKRIQPVRMMWHRKSTLYGFRWSSVFLLIFVSAVIYAGVVDDIFYLFLGFGYLAGGICWCVAMRLSSATIITDFAVIRDTRKCGNVLCWNQVVDFFVHDKGHTIQYIFLYVNPEGVHSRFEVQVPLTYKKVFDRIVYRCVEKKKSFTPEKAFG